MQVHLRTRRAAIWALAGVLALGGCSTGTPTGTATGGPPATANATPVPPTVAPSEAAVMILEDAGLETPMAPGTYTSRLFEPSLTIELDDGWFRRNAGDARRFNIRRGEDGGEDLTFFSDVDFIQCGDGEVVEPADASTIVDMLFEMPKLSTTQPEEVHVGDLTGTEIRLLGGGAGSLEAPEDWLKNGCVISIGEAFPSENSGWVAELGSTVEQLVFVEVDGVVVLIRARPDDSTADVEALWDYMREVIASVQFG